VPIVFYSTSSGKTLDEDLNLGTDNRKIFTKKGLLSLDQTGKETDIYKGNGELDYLLVSSNRNTRTASSISFEYSSFHHCIFGESSDHRCSSKTIVPSSAI